MARESRRDRVCFGAAIAGGIALIFFLVPLSQTILCAPQQQRVPTQQNSGATGQHQKQTKTAAKREARDPGKQNDTPQNAEDDYGLKGVLCGDMKLTDLALVFFTYCLVIVGWFTMRSADKNIEALERAYVFMGHDPPAIGPDQCPVMALTMRNVGRMTAIIKGGGYAFLQRSELPTKKRQRDWEWTPVAYDWAFPGNTAERRPFVVASSTILRAPQIFVAYIEYQDMYTKRRHRSWLGVRLIREGIGWSEEEVGGEEWNDWD